MTKLRVTVGDEFQLGEKTFFVSAAAGDACLAYPVGFPKLEQQFQKRDLATLLDTNGFAYKSSETTPLSTVARPTLAALHPVLQKEVRRRLKYVEGFIALLAASQYLNSKQVILESPQWLAAVKLTGGRRFYRTRKSANDAATFLQPKVDREGKFVLTDDHVIDVTEDAKAAPKRKRRHGQPKIVDGQESFTAIDEPSGSTLLDWLLRYEASGGNWESLKPQYTKSGNHGPKLADDGQAIITEQLPTYLTKEAISATRFLENVNTAIRRENDVRKGSREPLLAEVGLGAINKVIGQIDPYFADFCRLDAGIVKAKWSWVQDTIKYQVNGQRIEIDAYKTDLVTLLILSGAWSGLNREQRKKIRRERLWLTVAIDSATRVILAMRLSRSPDVPNGIALLDMVESDKSAISDAVGAETRWSQRTGLCTVVADGGFISAEMRDAVTEARATFENPIAGAAYLRPYIERVFRTVATQLMARLKGKTWSDVLQRGDYDSEGNAVIAEDELAWILVTWVVDIYHQTPHEGLGGATPEQAWAYAEEHYDVRPWRDAHGRRTAFGVPLKRAVTEQGVEVLGNFYRDDSPEGLRILRSVRNAEKCSVRVDVANIGAISIIIGEVAYTLPARDQRLEGVRASDWIEATAEVRRQFSASQVVSREIAYRALGRIIDKNNQAADRASIITRVYSAADLDYLEEGLFKRIRYAQPVDGESALKIGETIAPIDVAPFNSPATRASDADEMPTSLLQEPQQPTSVHGSAKTRRWTME